MIRRLIGLLVALALLGGLVAPAAAMATTPRTELCHCLTHDHCPMQQGPHTCGPDGTSFRQCDPGAGLRAVPALPPMLATPAAAPARLVVIAPAAAAADPRLVSHTTAPEPPPPKR